MSKHGISRRQFLQGFGASVIGYSLFSMVGEGAQAQIDFTSPSMGGGLAFYRTMVGELEVTIIKDGGFNLPFSNLTAEIDPEEAAQFFRERGIYRDGDVTPMIIDIMTIRSGDRLAIVDTGFGADNPAAGRLIPTLEVLGMSAGAVTDVIMSHFHGDHINGLSTGGAVNFPNAMVHMSQIEYDFVTTQAAAADALAKLQPAIDAEQISLYSDEDEIIPGVQARALIGHTMGHHGFLLESNGNRLLHVVDALLNMYVSTARPDWYALFDMVPAQAVETRRSILSSAAADQTPVFGYHFPFPGIGYMVEAGDAYQFLPVGY